MITIDATLCKKDGICAAQCPMGIIRWKKGDIPAPAGQARNLCINCGHCVAVCPQGALAHDRLTPEDSITVDKTMALTPEQTEHFLRARRSIRNFRKPPVDKETMGQIIRLAAFAPSGHNSQPVHWRVINGRDRVKAHTALVIDWMKLMIKEAPEMAAALHLKMLVTAWKFGMDTVTRNAPTLILAQGQADNITAQQACTIAMTYLDLAAQSFGVGTCWCGYFNRAASAYPPLAEKLGRDQGLITYGTMMAGYPKFNYLRMPPRQHPKITWED